MDKKILIGIGVGLGLAGLVSCTSVPDRTSSSVDDNFIEQTQINNPSPEEIAYNNVYNYLTSKKTC